jgi:hypothetical protein
MTEAKLKLSPPWITYVNMLEALFDGDLEIAFNLDIDANNCSVTLATNNPDKAAALVKLLPEKVAFGKVELQIKVDCQTISNLAFTSDKQLFETAFSENPAFAYAVEADASYFLPFTYVVFKRDVVQFFADNLHDPHGLISTLYQDIASEIFRSTTYTCGGGIAYATDIEHKILGMPEIWP